MHKVIIISTLIFSTLIADNSLGTAINSSATQQTKLQKLEKEEKLLSQQLANVNRAIKKVKQKQKRKLTTRGTLKKIKSNLKKEHHRNDKRYRSFDYERNGYYNNDGYYYGYYDDRGYFYNNVFYTYNNQYTHYDRQTHRRHFSYNRHHHRPHVYNSFNSWNRTGNNSCNREQRHHNRHNNHHIRRSITRMQTSQ